MATSPGAGSGRDMGLESHRKGLEAGAELSTSKQGMAKWCGGMDGGVRLVKETAECSFWLRRTHERRCCCGNGWQVELSALQNKQEY